MDSTCKTGTTLTLMSSIGLCYVYEGIWFSRNVPSYEYNHLEVSFTPVLSIAHAAVVLGLCQIVIEADPTPGLMHLQARWNNDCRGRMQAL